MLVYFNIQDLLDSVNSKVFFKNLFVDLIASIIAIKFASLPFLIVAILHFRFIKYYFILTLDGILGIN